MIKNLSAFLIAGFIMSSTSVLAQVGVEKENGAGISARLQHEINITKDPQLGYVPKSRLVEA